MIQSHVPVHVQCAGQIRVGLEPILREQSSPFFGSIIGTETGQFVSQATDFRHAIQPQPLADFSRRIILKLLDRLDTAEGHASQ